MAAWKRHGRLICLIAAALVCGAGCDVVSLPFFLMRALGQDSKQPPQLLKLVSDDKKKQVRVVVMAYAGLPSNPELITVDRDLTSLVTQHLQDSFTENKENVVLLPANKVQHFKDTHPHWYMDLPEVGKTLKADYVIYLQVDSLTLYEPGSHNTLYHARTDIEVSVLDMSKPDSAPVTRSFQNEYPRGSPQPADDKSAWSFEHAFLDRCAKDLVRYFDQYEYSDQIDIPQMQ